MKCNQFPWEHKILGTQNISILKEFAAILTVFKKHMHNIFGEIK